MISGKLRCPNDPKHDKFTVSAHIVQVWTVDRDANFESVSEECTDVTHAPDDHDYFECAECGAQAIIERSK